MRGMILPGFGIARLEDEERLRLHSILGLDWGVCRPLSSVIVVSSSRASRLSLPDNVLVWTRLGDVYSLQERILEADGNERWRRHR